MNQQIWYNNYKEHKVQENGTSSEKGHLQDYKIPVDDPFLMKNRHF